MGEWKLPKCLTQSQSAKDLNPGLSSPSGMMLLPWHQQRQREAFLALCDFGGACQPLCAGPWKPVEQVPLQAGFVEPLSRGRGINNAECSLLRIMDSRIPGIGWGREAGVGHWHRCWHLGRVMWDPGVAQQPSPLACFSSNWCPYQKSRLVTFVAACKTEKFLVHSQQPCPQETPDCQKVKVM